MMANDVPYAVVPYDGKISLPEYLDYNRNGDGWPEAITVWHVTTKDKLPSIRKHGLRGSDCSGWMSSMNGRPTAVYMFCARSVVADNIHHLLDNPADAVILRVTIPAKHAKNLFLDNIYNMSIEAAYMSSVQYRDDVPAKWITVE